MINVDLGDGRIFPMEAHLLEGPFQSAHRQCSRAHRDHAIHVSRQGRAPFRAYHIKAGIGVEAVLGELING